MNLMAEMLIWRALVIMMFRGISVNKALTIICGGLMTHCLEVEALEGVVGEGPF